jgi:hypothetical protein
VSAVWADRVSAAIVAVLFAVVWTGFAAVVGVLTTGDPWRVSIGFVFGIAAVDWYVKLRSER